VLAWSRPIPQHRTVWSTPGSNITGFTLVESAMGGKWLEFLQEIAPVTLRAALLFNQITAPPLKFYMPAIEAAASSFTVQVSAAAITPSKRSRALSPGKQEKPSGSLIVMRH
jgi:hypothetical protein